MPKMKNAQPEFSGKKLSRHGYHKDGEEFPTSAECQKIGHNGLEWHEKALKKFKWETRVIHGKKMKVKVYTPVWVDGSLPDCMKSTVRSKLTSTTALRGIGRVGKSS